MSRIHQHLAVRPTAWNPRAAPNLPLLPVSAPEFVVCLCIQQKQQLNYGISWLRLFKEQEGEKIGPVCFTHHWLLLGVLGFTLRKGSGCV